MNTIQSRQEKLYTNVTANLLSWAGGKGCGLPAWENWENVKMQKGRSAEHPHFFFPASHREAGWCVSSSIPRECICIPKIQQKKKLSSHCRNKDQAKPERRQGGEEKWDFICRQNLPKTELPFVRLSFLRLHLLIVSLGFYGHRKVGNTNQHQSIVNPKRTRLWPGWCTTRKSLVFIIKIASPKRNTAIIIEEF